MQKNVASQKLIVFAFTSTTNVEKTGDAANITAYVSKDYGAVTVLGDTSATEMDATNAKGYYLFDLTQAETNADTLLFSAKSATANIIVVAAPATVFTTPANFGAQSIDSNGRVDVIKVAGTTQTARDLGTSVLLSSGTGTGQLDFTSGVVKTNVTQLLGTAWLTPGTAGTPDVNAKLHGGTAQTGRDIGASVLLSSGTGTGQLDFTSGIVKANATQILGGTIPAVNVTGVPLVDLKYTLGTISPATAGSVRADSVTGAVGSVTGNVGGNVTGNVTGTIGGFAAGQGPRVRKNVALAAFSFLMTDSTAHAPATSKTVTVTRAIDGGSFVAGTLSAVTEMAAGWYKVDFAAGDLNGDVIAFRATATNCDDRNVTLITNP